MNRLLLLLVLIPAIVLQSCSRDRGPRPGPVQPRVFSYVDEFVDDRGNWSFADQANFAYGVVSNGSFKFDYNDDLSPAYYVSKRMGFNRSDDFTIYTRIGSNNNMGLLFGYNEATNSYGYSFMIDYDGYYALYDEGGNGYGPDISELVQPATAGFIHRDGDYNDLRLEQRGSRWLGFINDRLVFNIEAQRLKGTNVGFINVAFTQGEADYLEVQGYE